MYLNDFVTIEKFMQDNRDWTDKTFPDATLETTILHLLAECKELKESVIDKHTHENIMQEFADVFLLLLNAASRYGLKFSDLFNEAENKMSINVLRKWSKSDKGFYSHVEDDVLR